MIEEIIFNYRGVFTHSRKAYPGDIRKTYIAEYRAWMNMKTRCFKDNSKDYVNYGGRGIGVCKRWLFGSDKENGFLCFLRDMGKKPIKSYSIDRIDNDGHYEPKNCRWVSAATQCANQRKRRSSLIKKSLNDDSIFISFKDYKTAGMLKNYNNQERL